MHTSLTRIVVWSGSMPSPSIRSNRWYPQIRARYEYYELSNRIHLSGGLNGSILEQVAGVPNLVSVLGLGFKLG